MNDLDAHRLREALPDWVPECRYLLRTDSTNRVAMAWASQGARHGALVLADFQTAGRGRLGRDWTAPPGSSLLFSLILRPRVGPDSWPLLSLAAGVAVCEALAEFGLQAGLKWPNDVLLGGKKTAGILAEAAGGVVILGIGVNVGRLELPEHIGETATSLETFAGRPFNRLEVLSRLVSALSRQVHGPVDGIVARYREWSVTLGQQVRVLTGSGWLEDRAVDIDSSGGLVLAGGQVVTAGDVLQLR